MGKEHSNENHQKLKLLSIQIRATTFLKGTMKRRFLEDCIKRGDSEAVTLREIISLHYKLIERKGFDKSMPFDELLVRM